MAIKDRPYILALGGSEKCIVSNSKITKFVFVSPMIFKMTVILNSSLKREATQTLKLQNYESSICKSKIIVSMIHTKDHLHCVLGINVTICFPLFSLKLSIQG